MNKISKLVAASTLLLCGMSIATAANDGWLTCKDGLQARSAVVCDVHGGVLIEPVKSTPVETVKSKPIDTTKGVAAGKSAATKSNTQQAKSSGATPKKTASKTTRNPTAKCLDGAYYFSTERRGACAKHGGVDSWYGW